MEIPVLCFRCVSYNLIDSPHDVRLTAPAEPSTSKPLRAAAELLAPRFGRYSVSNRGEMVSRRPVLNEVATAVPRPWSVNGDGASSRSRSANATKAPEANQSLLRAETAPQFLCNWIANVPPGQRVRELQKLRESMDVLHGPHRQYGR